MYSCLSAGGLVRHEYVARRPALHTRARGEKVTPEVSKPTPFGRRVIDLEVEENGKVLGGVETKTGGSRYLPMQRLKDIWLDLNTDGGYTVQLVRKPPTTSAP